MGRALLVMARPAVCGTRREAAGPSRFRHAHRHSILSDGGGGFEDDGFENGMDDVDSGGDDEPTY